MWYLIVLGPLRFYHLIVSRSGLVLFVVVFGLCGLFKGFKVANFLFAPWSWLVWFLIDLLLRFYHLFACRSRSVRVLVVLRSSRPPWDFPTFFPAVRYMCIFYYSIVFLGDLRTYHLIIRRFGWACVISGSYCSLRGLLIFFFSSLVRAKVISISWSPLRSLWGFTTYLLKFPRLCYYLKFFALLAANFFARIAARCDFWYL